MTRVDEVNSVFLDGMKLFMPRAPLARAILIVQLHVVYTLDLVLEALQLVLHELAVVL